MTIKLTTTPFVGNPPSPQYFYVSAGSGLTTVNFNLPSKLSALALLVEVIPSGNDEYYIDDFKKSSSNTDNFNTAALTVTRASISGWTVDSKTSYLKLHTSPGNRSVEIAGPLFKNYTGLSSGATYEFSMKDITEYTSGGGSGGSSMFDDYTVLFYDGSNTTPFQTEVFNLNNSTKFIIFNAPSSSVKIEIRSFKNIVIGRYSTVDDLRLRNITSTYLPVYLSLFNTSISNANSLDGWSPDSWSTTSATIDYSGGNYRLVAIGSSATATVRRDFATNASEQHTLEYNLALLNSGSATVKVQQLVGSSYVDIAGASQTHTASGSYTLTFTPTQADIRVVVSGTSRFALTQIFLDRTRMDEVTTTYMVKAGGYRYGFNGMEKDDEVKGAGNSYTTEFRQYDPRLGRWLSIDPLFQNFPWQSPYVAFDNNPIILVDPKGLAAENGDDAKSNQSGFPENAKEGQEFIDINGRKWEFMKSEDGKSSDWVRASGDLPEAIVLPEKVKAEYKKNYERLQRNRTSIMGQFIGDGTAWQGVIPDGRSIYYDPLINDPNNPNATNWQKARANHKALEKFVQAYIEIGTAPLGGGIGGVRSLVVSMGLGATVNFGSQMYAKQGDIGSVDWIGVAAGGLSGAFRNPWLGATFGGVLDAGFDHINGDFRTPFDKTLGNMGNDLFWGSLGNYGAASFAKYPRFYSTVGSTITTIPTTTINTITNNELGY